MRNIGPRNHVAPDFPKKRRLGPQNGSRSSGLEKLLKIVSCAETEKLKETIVGPQVGLIIWEGEPLRRMEKISPETVAMIDPGGYRWPPTYSI